MADEQAGRESTQAPSSEDSIAAEGINLPLHGEFGLFTTSYSPESEAVEAGPFAISRLPEEDAEFLSLYSNSLLPSPDSNSLGPDNEYDENEDPRSLSFQDLKLTYESKDNNHWFYELEKTSTGSEHVIVADMPEERKSTGAQANEQSTSEQATGARAVEQSTSEQAADEQSTSEQATGAQANEEQKNGEQATIEQKIDTTPEEDLWRFLSHFILDWHARTWFGEEEYDRIAINEHCRRITRYGVVDIVVVVSWVLAELLQIRECVSDLLYTSLVYTITSVGSAMMLILSFFHVSNKECDAITKRASEPERDFDYLAQAEEIATRCNADRANLEGRETGHHRWKILYLRNVNSVFRPESRIGKVPYSLTSSRRLPVIFPIMRDLAQLTNKYKDLGSSASGANGTLTEAEYENKSLSEASESGRHDVEEQQRSENPSKIPSETTKYLVSQTATNGNTTIENSHAIFREILSKPPLLATATGESALTGREYSVLRQLLSKPPLNQINTDRDQSSASTSREAFSAQTFRYSEMFQQKLKALRDALRTHLEVSDPRTEQQKKEAELDRKDKTRYSCIKRQRKNDSKSLAEESSVASDKLESVTSEDGCQRKSGDPKSLAEGSLTVVSDRQESVTYPQNRFFSPNPRKRSGDFPTDIKSGQKKGRSAKGKMSMSLKYRYKKGSKTSKTDDTVSAEPPLLASQSSNPSVPVSIPLSPSGIRSRSIDNESTGERSAKRSKIQYSTEDARSAIENPLDLSTSRKGAPGTSSSLGAGSVIENPLDLSTSRKGAPSTSSSLGAGSVIENPLDLSTPREGAPSTSSNQPGQSGQCPASENEISNVLIIPESPETEYVIRRVPASFQCEEIDPPPEIKLVVTLLEFLDNLGLTIKSGIFNLRSRNLAEYAIDTVALKVMFEQCYEVLRSSVLQKGMPPLRLYQETLQRVLQNIEPLLKDITGSPAILEALGEMDDKDKIHDLY